MPAMPAPSAEASVGLHDERGRLLAERDAALAKTTGTDAGTREPVRVVTMAPAARGRQHGADPSHTIVLLDAGRDWPTPPMRSD